MEYKGYVFSVKLEEDYTDRDINYGQKWVARGRSGNSRIIAPSNTKEKAIIGFKQMVDFTIEADNIV